MVAMRGSNRSSATTDQSVGARIRALRRERGVTQARFADALGVTFQQIQKYELGRNRVSASRLYDMAVVLNVPVSVFFDGLPSPCGAPPTQTHAEALNRFLHTPQAAALIGAFPEVATDQMRALIVDLTAALTQQERPRRRSRRASAE